jgi:predicted transposase/invertase (TIGR01784 family)
MTYDGKQPYDKTQPSNATQPNSGKQPRDNTQPYDETLPSDELLPDGMPRVLAPYDNDVFHALMTLPEANAALVSSVGAFIGRKLRTATLRNNDAPSRDRDAKREKYDVNCVVDGEDGDQCAVEMQATHMRGDSKANDHRNIKWRGVYSACHLHANQRGRGIDYGEFVKSYQVMLCNYGVFGSGNDLAERFTFRSVAGRELCDAVTVIFVDLTQAKEIARKPVGDMTDIEAWVVFLALANRPEYGRTVMEIAKTSEGIAAAYDTLLGISLDPDERARLHSHRMWLQDREHDFAVARKEGREEAREEYEPIIAEQAAALADKDALIAQLRARLGEDG